MCGITGIYHLHGVADHMTRERVQAMTDVVAHRGPDAEGVYTHGPACLGHRRLAIIDLDTRSDQPFTDASGRYTIVFNGQIYNFAEIKAQLTDYPFRTTSDTEVIVAAYARWKERCLDKMHGMFAFVIYDANDSSLFMARDRFGVKPFYYSLTDHHFVFASELRSLLASGLVRKKIGSTGLLEYLMFQSALCPNTILEDVKQIKPAHYALLSDGVLTQTRYWRFGSTCDKTAGSYAEATGTIRNLMFESVERRLVSDVPLGAFLSGGIDSSAIVAIMAQISDHVNTFSITFDEHEYNEGPYAKIIADKYRTHHHPIRLRASDLLDQLPNALDAMDSPSVDGMNIYVVSKATKEAGVTVALSGLGADELFAGYHYFRVWYQMKRLGLFHVPQFLRQALAKINFNGMDASRMERLKRLALSNGSMAETYPVFRQVSGKIAAMEMAKQKTFPLEETITVELKDNDLEYFSHLSQLSIAELTSYTLNVLLKDTDQFSMASALEVREPFFDHSLVDYVVKLPDKWKLGKTPKRLLTDAMGTLLPSEIVHRPKRGFLLPWEHWLKHEFADYGKEQIEYLAARDEFDGDKVRAAWTTFAESPKGTTWPYVWQLIALSHWIRKNLDQ